MARFHGHGSLLGVAFGGDHGMILEGMERFHDHETFCLCPLEATWRRLGGHGRAP